MQLQARRERQVFRRLGLGFRFSISLIPKMFMPLALPRPGARGDINLFCLLRSEVWGYILLLLISLCRSVDCCFYSVISNTVQTCSKTEATEEDRRQVNSLPIFTLNMAFALPTRFAVIHFLSRYYRFSASLPKYIESWPGDKFIYPGRCLSPMIYECFIYQWNSVPQF